MYVCDHVKTSDPDLGQKVPFDEVGLTACCGLAQLAARVPDLNGTFVLRRGYESPSRGLLGATPAPRGNRATSG